MAANRCLERKRAAKKKQKTAPPHFVWIKALCHKITDLSEQERGRDPCSGRSISDSRFTDKVNPTNAVKRCRRLETQLNYRSLI